VAAPASTTHGLSYKLVSSTHLLCEIVRPAGAPLAPLAAMCMSSSKRASGGVRGAAVAVAVRGRSLQVELERGGRTEHGCRARKQCQRRTRSSQWSCPSVCLCLCCLCEQQYKLHWLALPADLVD